jgi:hypothetical protein
VALLVTVFLLVSSGFSIFKKVKTKIIE